MAVPATFHQFRQPVESINLVLNPGGEGGSGSTPSNVTTVGTATVTRVTTYSRQNTPDSSYSVRVQTSAINSGVRYTMKAASNDQGWVVLPIRGTYTAANLRVTIGGTTKTPTLYETDGAWALINNDGDAFLAAAMNGATTVDITHTTSGADFYLDDIVVQQGTYWTTPFHGSYPGCRWEGVRHQSASTLYKEVPETGEPNLAAGRVISFGNTTTALITSFAGWGVPDIENATIETVQRGKIFQSAKLGARTIALTATLTYDDTASVATHHSRRAALIDYVSPGERFIYRYRGNPTFKGGTNDVMEIECVYAAGFPGNLDFKVYWEDVPLTLTAHDPLYRTATETITELTKATTGTMSYAVRRRVLEGWDTPGGGLGPNVLVSALASSPNGHIFVGGFGGSNHLRGWDGTSWADCGVMLGGTLSMEAMAFDPSGTILYVGGQWSTSIGGVANTVRIAKYTLPSSGVSGGTFAAMGTGMNGTVHKIVTVPTSSGHDVYAFGEFTTAGGTSATHAAKWNGSAWSALGPNTVSSNGYIYDALLSPDNFIYFCGAMTSIGTVSAPSAPTLSTAISGTLNGSYGYKVSALTGNGETLCSAAGGPASPSNQGVRVTYSLPTGATGGWIYRTTASGVTYYRLAKVEAGTTTYDDTGAVTLSQVVEPTAATDGSRTKYVGKYDITNNAFAPVGQSGMNTTVKAIARTVDGTLYAGGGFTSADGIVCNRFAACVNDLIWGPCGDDGGGVTGGDVESVLVLPDNSIAIGGAFTALKDPLVGTLGANLAFWYPGALGGAGVWAHSDFVYPTSTTVSALMNDHNLDLWTGFNTTGSATYSAQTTVTTGGTVGAFLSYPRVYIVGPGVFRGLINITTGQAVWFNLPVATDEVITLDFRKGYKTITSNLYDAAGNPVSRAQKFIAGDMGGWGLRAGVNRVRALFTGTSGNAVIRLSDPELRVTADK